MRRAVSCCLARRALLWIFLSGTSWLRLCQTSTLPSSSRKTHKRARRRRQQVVSMQLLTVCCTDVQCLHTLTAGSQSGLHVGIRGAVSTAVSQSGLHVNKRRSLSYHQRPHAASYSMLCFAKDDPQVWSCVSALPVWHAASKGQAASESTAAAAGASDAKASAAAEVSGQASDLPIQLSAMRKADVADFKGTVYVNIREYYEVSLVFCCLLKKVKTVAADLQLYLVRVTVADA